MSVFKNVKSECPFVGKHWLERVSAACPGPFIPCKLSLEANPTLRGSDSFKRCVAGRKRGMRVLSIL